MTISQRLSRGFHRLGLFLAVIPMLVGGFYSYVYAVSEASRPSAEINSKPALHIEGYGAVPLPQGFEQLTKDEQNEIVDQIADSLRPHWWIQFAETLTLGLAITLAVSLAVYGIVRAIGWVIGGFASS